MEFRSEFGSKNQSRSSTVMKLPISLGHYVLLIAGHSVSSMPLQWHWRVIGGDGESGTDDDDCENASHPHPW